MRVENGDCALAHDVKCALRASLVAKLVLAVVLSLIMSAGAYALTPSGPIVISGQSGTVISGLKITSTTGDCVEVINSTNVTIENSEIGPCGSNNSTANSRGIYISGGSGISVYDSYIHVENQSSVCGDSHDGIFITNAASDVTIQGNVIAYNEQNIRVWDASGISIVGNFVLNPRGALSCSDPDNLPGHSIQAWADGGTGYWNSNITVSNNYLLNSSSTTYLYPSNSSDLISAGLTHGFTANGNYVAGGNFANACGVIADFGTTNANFSGNIISNPVGCGIGLAGGAGAVVSNNKILSLTPSASYATGITINGGQCPISITGNIASAFQGNGPNQGAWNQAYWSSGSCATPSLSSNTFDTGCTLPSCPAYNQLNPIATTNPPPPIPVQPKNCAALSPYTNNTSVPSCGTSPPPPPPPPPPPTSFTIGTRVAALANISVWNKANLRGKMLCTQPMGAQGTIVGGPSTSHALTWWVVNFDTGCDGWVVQSGLEILP